MEPTKKVRSKTIDPKTKCLKSSIQYPENKWVWILRDSVNSATSNAEEQYGVVITLKHPNSGTAALFLYSHSDNTVQEILSCEDKKRSWFIGESVKSDGKLKISTPMDPIFLVLPYLQKYCVTQAIPIDQLLCDEEFPKIEMLLKCPSLKTLDLVADKKGSDDLQAYKYNEEKTLKWLERKTHRVASILAKKNFGGVANGIASSTFTKSSRGDNSNSENMAYLKYAHGIVSDYIQPELSQKLLRHLDLLEEPVVSLKRKSSLSTADVKKQKIEQIENISTGPSISEQPKAKPAKQTHKEKLRVKAASSSKSITSFFKKT